MNDPEIVFDSSLSEAILKFWLVEIGPEGWYRVDPETDAMIRARFKPVWQAAMAGRLIAECRSPEASLARVILLDQFPRNMFRGTAEAFASDRLALGTAYSAIRLGHDLEIDEPARRFFYLPLMHSERLADQERCIRMFLLKLPKTGPGSIEHGVKHREVIRRFGRFPSRNAALGRRDTEAELAYRAEGGYMSGA